MSFLLQEAALIGYIQEKSPGLNTLGTSSEYIGLVLSSPNNILGIEYCKALLRLNSRIIPHALLRKGSGYHDTGFSLLSDDKFPSASGIRNLMKKSEKAGQSADFSRLIPSASISGFLDSLEKGAWLSDSALTSPLQLFWNPKKLTNVSRSFGCTDPTYVLKSCNHMKVFPICGSF